MRIAVTGGAGFVGSHLVAGLLHRGHDVVVLDNLHRGSFERPLLAGAQIRRGDIRSLEDCVAAFEGCGAVVHLAAQSNVMGSQSDPDYTYETNVTGTWRVARAAGLARVPHLVFASSREVYGEPETLPVREDQPLRPHNLYGASKIAGETLLRGLPDDAPAVSILRLANVVGPGDSGRVVPLWLSAARSGGTLTLYGGGQVLDFVPVEMVVEAFTRLVERPLASGPINIGSGVATHLHALADRIVRLSGGRARIATLPPRGPEVSRFLADTVRMQTALGLQPPADPLAAMSLDWAG